MTEKVDFTVAATGVPDLHHTLAVWFGSNTTTTWFGLGTSITWLGFDTTTSLLALKLLG